MLWHVLKGSKHILHGPCIWQEHLFPSHLTRWNRGFQAQGSNYEIATSCKTLQHLATIWIPCLVLFAMAIRLESSAPFARHWFTSQPRSSAFFQKYSVRHPPLQPNAKAGSVTKWQAKCPLWSLCQFSSLTLYFLLWFEKKKQTKTKTFCEILSFWNPATVILGILDEAKDAKGNPTLAGWRLHGTPKPKGLL